MKNRQRAVGKKREIRFDGGNASVMRRTKGAECILGKASAGPAVCLNAAAVDVHAFAPKWLLIDDLLWAAGYGYPITDTRLRIPVYGS